MKCEICCGLGWIRAEAITKNLFFCFTCPACLEKEREKAKHERDKREITISIEEIKTLEQFREQFREKVIKAVEQSEARK